MNFSLDDIKQQVYAVLKYSQEVPDPKIDDLMNRWYAAKRTFIVKFGGLIKKTEFPVTFTLSPEARRERYNEFLNTLEDTYGFIRALDFLCWLTTDEVFNNHTTRDYMLEDGEKIPAGAKVSKALEKFELSGPELRAVQDSLSMVIQEDKISGTLCFSVHPLDFLSSSENCHHWRSCHALNGDYRMGNLSYMVDSSTVVCYLCNGKDTYQLPNFPASVPWNSKKWRMLLFFSEYHDVLFAGRQYPFFCPGALDVVKRNLVNEDYWSPWFNDEFRFVPNRDRFDCLNDAYVAINGGIYAKHDIIHDNSTLHFNDLLNSSCYTPYFCWNAYSYTHNKPVFSIGGMVPCIHCGEGRVNPSEGTMVCEECFDELQGEDPVYCACCDCRIPSYRARAYSRYYDGIICEDCFEEMGYCEHCSEYYPTNMLVKNPNSDYEYWCVNCLEKENKNGCSWN